ncbi:MAG: TonB-dependent receptor [Burkholderiales bacterium]|nr:TonB-dependent receptor [Burkholderiales bacterium]
MNSQFSAHLDAGAGIPLRLSLIAAACALALVSEGARAQAAPAPAAAASAAAADGTAATQIVTVTGLRHAIESAIATKHDSNSIVEVISAEDIGKLPDASIAESLARLPGLTGQRGPDGRVNVISIRGLSPEFSGVLFNGREMVSSNDSRALEYDQFPAELIGGAVVYKTPDASLVGQGLSGTVDLHALRPLDLPGRQIAVGLRGERNSNGTLVPGVASPTGKRFSISYVDQFLDHTLGLAVGYARLDDASQVKQTQLVQYGDYTPYGLPLSGNAPALFPAGGNLGQSMLPMYWTATSSTKKNTRDGLMAVLEYKPNKDLHSELDLYYSKFDTHEVGGTFLASLFATWGSGFAPHLSNVGTTQVGQNTYTTSATADQMPVTTQNFDTRRKDSIAALGWNTSLKLGDEWTAVSDLSYSKDTRHETFYEAYAFPFNTATQSPIGAVLSWNVPVNGGPQTFTPTPGNFMADPAILKLGDQPGFSFVPDNHSYFGALRQPVQQDEIKSLRFSVKHPLSGIFSRFETGVNYTQRDKTVAKNESRLLMKQDANGNNIRDIPSGVLQTPFDLSWAGVPSLLRYDVAALAQSGNVTLQPGQFSKKPADDSGVHEKVATVYGMLDIDTEWGPVPLRGNLGVQLIHTQQRSDGWDYLGNDTNPDPNLLFRRYGGASYNDVLPSLNLAAELGHGTIVRVGVAKTMVRPNIVDMRAGSSTPMVNSDQGGPNVGTWSMAYAGNPELRPWRANAFDLSIEKYFGKRSYLSAAVFHKQLLTYIYNQQSVQSTAGFPVVLPPGVTADQVRSTGPVTKPTNGNGGRVEGVELAASLEGGLVSPYLDGFGVVVSASKLNSSIYEKDNGNVPLNGLSGLSNSLTFYYEKYGFSARVSQRYRSPFTATTRDIYFNSVTTEQAADKVVDLQLGYEFQEGTYKGLSFLLQVLNLRDSATSNRVSVGANAPDATQLLPNYTYRYGRVSLLGMNYKF